jgi:hypothetical protein
MPNAGNNGNAGNGAQGWAALKQVRGERAGVPYDVGGPRPGAITTVEGQKSNPVEHPPALVNNHDVINNHISISYQVSSIQDPVSSIQLSTCNHLIPSSSFESGPVQSVPAGCAHSCPLPPSSPPHHPGPSKFYSPIQGPRPPSWDYCTALTRCPRV